MNVDVFKLLYNVNIRPHLKFCVQTWSSYFKKDIVCMKKVQRRATKMIYGFGNLKYEERLERLNIFSLQYRRMRGNMIETYIIISGLEDVNPSQLFDRSSMDNLRGHSLKLYKEHFCKISVRNFFSEGDRSMEWAAGRSCKSKNVEHFQEFFR